MDSWKLQLLWSKKGTITFMWLTFVLCVKAGRVQDQVRSCRPFCSEGDCVTVNLHRVDFAAAEQACHDRKGELMTFQTETDENIFDLFGKELVGSYWVGLFLPPGACSNLSAPLRNYVWTSASMQISALPSRCTWTDSVKVCGPQCVSLSSDKRMTARACTDNTDGFLCRTKHKNACQTHKLSETKVFRSTSGCSAGPCEHICTGVAGGYTCSCFRGYTVDQNNARRCHIHCSQRSCPAVCQSGTDDCSCPKGYIRDGTTCEDIDECTSDRCEQGCENTFGSFVCSCKKGFELKNQIHCIQSEHSTRSVTTTPEGGATKSFDDDITIKGSSASGAFVWMWILLALAAVVFIFIIRFYVVKRQRSRERNFSQQSVAPADNNEF